MAEVLAGRSVDTPLTEQGRREASALAAWLAETHDIAHVQTSPRDRARSTAAAVAERCSAAPEVEAALDEVDFGEWSGRTFHDLEDDLRWRAWNSARLTGRAPGGEHILEVQQRIVMHLERMQERHGERCVALVSHAETIRSALLYYLGAPLDAYDRLEIGPASVSTLRLGDGGAKVVAVNEARRDA